MDTEAPPPAEFTRGEFAMLRRVAVVTVCWPLS